MQDTGNGSGQGWDKRAFSAQVAEWAIAVGDETGASVAHPARPLRRGVGGLAGAEHAHYRLKDAIDQALILRGSRDFDTADDYAGFVRQLVGRRNRLAEGKLEQEMLCLRSLPPHRLIGAQAGSLRPLPLPGAAVSHHALQADLRRAQGMAW